MVIIGAKSVKDTLSFSMEDCVEQSDWTVEQYLMNKLSIAEKLVTDSNPQRRMDGLNAFFNFLGLKSVCSMFATDFEEKRCYTGVFAEKLPSILFVELRQIYTGWIADVEKAVAIYSHTANSIL